MTKKAVSLFFRIFVSLGSIALVFWSQRAHLKEAFEILHQHVNWWYVLLAYATHITALGIISLRLKYVFETQHIHLTFKETNYLTWVGLFFNLFLPSAIGGDVIKVYYAYQHSHKKIQSGTCVFWDRLLGFATLVSMAIVAVAFFNKEFDDPRIDYLVFGFLTVFAFMVLFFMSKRFANIFRFLKHLVPSVKLRQMFSEIYHSIYTFKHNRGLFAATLCLSVIGQACFIIVHNWLSLALGISVNPWIFFVLIPILTVFSMAPSLGGLGVREAGIVFLFRHYMPSERALALSLLLDMLIYSLSFTAGIIYAFKGGLKTKLMKEMEGIHGT